MMRYKLYFSIDGNPYQIATQEIDTDNTVSEEIANEFAEQLRKTINFSFTAVDGRIFAITERKMKDCYFFAKPVHEFGA